MSKSSSSASLCHVARTVLKGSAYTHDGVFSSDCVEQDDRINGALIKLASVSGDGGDGLTW